MKIISAMFYTAIPIGGAKHNSLKSSISLLEKGYEGWSLDYRDQELVVRAATGETFIVPSIGVKFMKVDPSEYETTGRSPEKDPVRETPPRKIQTGSKKVRS